MSKWILPLTFVSALCQAAPTTTPSSAPSPSSQATIQKDHAFEDLLVQGKYHFAEESTTTVEADRVLDALIGVRTDFKDRLEASEKGY